MSILMGCGYNGFEQLSQWLSTGDSVNPMLTLIDDYVSQFQEICLTCPLCLSARHMNYKVSHVDIGWHCIIVVYGM